MIAPTGIENYCNVIPALTNSSSQTYLTTSIPRSSLAFSSSTIWRMFLGP